MTVSAVSAAATQAATIPKKTMNELSTEDFLKLLIAELTHQDPFEPMKNQELLNQVSSIRELEMNTNLNQTLQSLVLQGNLSSASNLIGKSVAGLDTLGDMVAGEVLGVVVSDGQVLLQLDNGSQVNVEMVTEVGPGPTSVEEV